MSLEKLTFIIVTYQKHEALDRILRAYQQELTNIVIVDGSRKPFLLHDYPGQNLKTSYLHIPGKANYLQRLAVGIFATETPYCLIMDDEDFYFLNGVEEILAKLEAQEEFISMSGLAYFVDHSGLFPRLQPWGKWHSGLDISANSRIARLKKVLETDRTANVFYSIHRTSNLKQVASSLYGCKTNWINFAELAIVCFLILRGKHLQIDEDFIVRNGSNRTETASQKKRKFMSDKEKNLLVDITLSGVQSKDIFENTKTVIERFVKHSKLNFEENSIISRPTRKIRTKLKNALIYTRLLRVYRWTRLLVVEIAFIKTSKRNQSRIIPLDLGFTRASRSDLRTRAFRNWVWSSLYKHKNKALKSFM